MDWLSKFLRGLSAIVSLTLMLATARADAQSPIGRWEISVSGQVSGNAAKGIGYVEFYADGTLAGYALLRQRTDFSTVGGSWSLNGISFGGVLSVETGGVTQSFILTGKVGRTGSMLAALQSGSGDRVTLRGKPLIALPDRSGHYYGQFRQYGLTGSVSLQFAADPSLPGVFQIGGIIQLAGVTYHVTGAGIIDRAGNLVAYTDNLETGGGGMLSGKFKPTGALSGSGIDAYDGSSIRFSLSR